MSEDLHGLTITLQLCRFQIDSFSRLRFNSPLSVYHNKISKETHEIPKNKRKIQSLLTGAVIMASIAPKLESHIGADEGVLAFA